MFIVQSLTLRKVLMSQEVGSCVADQRNPAGHRRHDSNAASAPDLGRTLRELGLDLAGVARKP